MAGKPKTLLDEVVTVAASQGYKHGGGTWFDRLPEDVQKELNDVKKAIHEGKVYGPRRVFARAIVQTCKDRGIRVCGVQGVETWLRQKS